MEEEKLWFSCSEGDIEDVINLLQNPQINTNWQDSQYSRTPFWIACEKGHIEIVKLFLNDKRVDINQANKDGATPFFIACYDGQIKIVKLLLSDERVDINKVDSTGQTPFWTACQNEDIEIVKLLLNDKRVDINKVDNFEMSPFYIACLYGYIEIVKYLLAFRREIDINKAINGGKTGLDVARERRKIEKGSWESEEEFENRKRKYTKIIELIESFERNQNETRTKLRIELGLAGKFIYLLTSISLLNKFINLYL